MSNGIIEIIVESKKLCKPVDEGIVDKAVGLLNMAFNLPEFKHELIKQKFFCSNRPNFCQNKDFISGADVYEDFINTGVISVKLFVKPLINPWRRFISKTYGVTDVNGNEIVTYTWWLSNNKKDLIREYASHIGHEIFHTRYFQYIHDPKYNSRNFDNNKDVTYKIDEILESLIRQNYN